MLPMMAKRILTFVLILQLSFPSQTWSLTPHFVADPVETLKLKTVPAKVVKFVPKQIPANCNKIYRTGMEDQLLKVWAQCQEIGRMEPSDCQRQLFSYCTETADKLQNMEVGSCAHMVGDADYLDKTSYSVFARTQNTAQKNTAQVNQDAFRIQLGLAQRLKTNSGDLHQISQQGRNISYGSACRNNLFAKNFQRATSQMTTSLKGTEKFLNDFRTLKILEAAQMRKNALLSKKYELEMRSQSQVTNTVSSRPTPTTNPNGNTATSTATSTSTSTSTATSTATLTTSMINTNSTVTTDTGTKKKKDWIPLIAIGVGAAILIGIVAFGNSSEKENSEPTPSSPGSNTTENDPPAAPSSSEREDAKNDPEKSSEESSPNPVVNSHEPAELSTLGIKVDSSFLDREKLRIAQAVTRIPSCYHSQLKGLHIENDVDLKFRGSGECLRGKQINSKLIKLNNRCKREVETHIVVHELFHILGNNGLYAQYRQIFNKYPNCPVSQYSADPRSQSNYFNEDFAEAARLAVFPMSKGKLNSSCANSKIQETLKIVKSCK